MGRVPFCTYKRWCAEIANFKYGYIKSMQQALSINTHQQGQAQCQASDESLVLHVGKNMQKPKSSQEQAPS